MVIIWNKIAVAIIWILLSQHYLLFLLPSTTISNFSICWSMNHNFVPWKAYRFSFIFSSRNYIVQYVLKQRNPSYLAIIASRFRSNYVTLSRQRYSSNVVETCLEVFIDRDRSNIVHELIRYHPFRDLVSDEFANYVISRALTTCKVICLGHDLFS